LSAFFAFRKTIKEAHEIIAVALSTAIFSLEFRAQIHTDNRWHQSSLEDKTCPLVNVEPLKASPASPADNQWNQLTIFYTSEK
jgi:hypothetical protein